MNECRDNPDPGGSATRCARHPPCGQLLRTTPSGQNRSCWRCGARPCYRAVPGRGSDVRIDTSRPAALRL